MDQALTMPAPTCPRSNNPRLSRFARASIAAAAFGLTACGGGGSDTVTINGQPSTLTPCAIADSITLTTVYDLGGVPYAAGALINVTVGQPIAALPRIQGLPATCSNSVQWTFSAVASSISGLTFDRVGGAVSGTPRAGEVLEVNASWLVVGSPRFGSGQFRFVGR